jgi:sulfur carrier protein ThiS
MHRLRIATVVELLGETEISQDSVAFSVEEDVLRLEVSDDDTVSMAVESAPRTHTDTPTSSRFG